MKSSFCENLEISQQFVLIRDQLIAKSASTISFLLFLYFRARRSLFSF